MYHMKGLNIDNFRTIAVDGSRHDSRQHKVLFQLTQRPLSTRLLDVFVKMHGLT